MAKDLSAKIVINAEDRTQSAFGKTRAGVESISQQLEKAQRRLEGFLALKVGDIITRQIGAVIETADAYKSLDARLKLVSDSTTEYTIAQKALFDISQRTRADLSATTDLYGRIETSVKSLGGSQKQALSVTETINKAIALTGPAAESSRAGLIQFIQGLDGGALRGQEFNSVMEQTPGLARAIADGLNVPVNKLREMAEAGELTADRLVNALGESAPRIAEQFNQLPVTVGQAMTGLLNAGTVIIGNADKALGITEKLAGGIQTLSRNLDQVANVGEVFAEILGARLALGLTKSAKAMVDGAVAARQKALADVQAREASVALLREETILAGVKVKSAKADVEAARLQSALAVTERQRAQGLKALEQAYRNLHRAIDAANAKQVALDNALSGSADKLSKSEKAWNALNGAISLFAAYEVGKTVGEWLNQFDLVRQAGTYLAETLAILTTGMDSILSGQSISDRFAQIQRIHAEFEQIRANQTANAQQQAQATAATEQAKTQAVEQAAQLQAESFKRVQEASKALTAQLDADAKAQNLAIQQALTERNAAIDAADISTAEKDTLKLQAKLQAGVQELQLQQTLATEKLNLIDAEYAKELEGAKANKDRLNQVESEKRQAKLGVYQGLAQFYQSEIDKLNGVYSNELNAATQAKQNLQTLELNHQHALREIERLGFDEKQKQDSLESEYEDTLLKLRQEQAKGKQASQEKINELLSQAKDLHGEITTAAVNSAETQEDKRSAIYEAQDRLNKLYSIEKGILKENEKAHADNAEVAKQAIESYKTKLDEVNTVIGNISKALKEEMLLKIGIDQGSLNAVRDEIAKLTKPETKIITVQTVETKSAAPSSGSAETSSGVFSGGFANGGAVRPKPFTGFLPGYGGGDRRLLLAEDGEFVVKKEAVKRIGQDKFDQFINNGVLPPSTSTVGDLMKRMMGGAVRRATGGLIDDKILKNLGKLKEQSKSAKDERDIDSLINGITNAEKIADSSLVVGGLYSKDVRFQYIIKALEEQARARNRMDLFPQFVEIIKATLPENSQFTEKGGNSEDRQTKFDLRKLLFDDLKNSLRQSSNAALSTTKVNIPPMPDIVNRAGAPGASVGANVIAPEIIKLDLSFNGQTASGTFPKTDVTKQFLDEIKRAGFAAR